jgi:flagellar basal body-associated protein FliL
MAAEGIQPGLVGRGRGHDRGAAYAAGRWVREQLTTTPGRLALMAVITVFAAVALGAVALVSEQARERAVNSARTDTEPLLAEAVNLYGSLSDANATATTTFLVGGLEPPARRARYLRDVGSASDSLAALTRQVGGSGAARDAVATITGQLPIYTGLVEAARANNRQKLPIGAAYMRQASELMTGTILPAAGRLYTIEAQRLRDDYNTGTSTAWLIAFAAAFVVMLGLLVWAQLYLARISHRILNVPLVVATVLVAAVGIWGLLGLISSQNALSRAQRNGSDPVEVSSAARILVSRAQSDDSLTLIARGGDTTDPEDFTAVIGALGTPGGSSGLVTEIEALARRTGSEGAAAQFVRDLGAWLSQHNRVESLASGGLTKQANALAAGSASAGQSPADRVTTDLTAQIRTAQGRFEQAADDASSALDGLSVAIPVAIVLAMFLTLFGVRQRALEYR